jgi:glycosyltransferase involved in cell wall biosynthesis
MHVTFVNYVMTVMRGGGETRDLYWLRELRRLGVDVRLLSIRPLFGPVRYPVAEFPLDLVRAPYLREHVYRLMGRPVAGRLAAHMLDFESRVFCARASRALARWPGPLDLVHATGLFRLARVKQVRPGVRVVVRHMGDAPSVRDRPLLPLADAIVGDGSGALGFQAATGHPIHFVPGGVDAGLFAPGTSALKQALGLDGREIVLFAGRLVPVKNVPLLLEAFARLRRRRPAAALLVSGEGPGEAAARAQAARLGVAADVHFLGAVPHSRMPALYNAADVFALSSSFDNSPNVVLEAMACGRPVVATRVGGVPLYVQHEETGLLVDSGDPEGLASALERVLTDRDESATFAARARERVLGSFTWARSAATLMDVYRGVLGSPVGA